MDFVRYENLLRDRLVLKAAFISMLILGEGVLVGTPVLADFATPFVEINNKVGDVSEAHGYVTALGHSVEDCKYYLVVVGTDYGEYIVIRATADKGVIKESLLGRPVIIKAKVTSSKEDPKTKQFVVQLEVLSVKSSKKQESEQPGRPDGQATDLRMSVTVEPAKKAGGTSLFYITIQNTGDEGVILNLGTIIANGEAQWPDAVRLILTGPNGQSRELRFTDRRYPGIAGRADDYVVPLRAGSAYTLKLSSENYWCPETSEPILKLKDGEYHVRAELTAKETQRPYSGPSCFWTGKLNSDTVAFLIGEPG